MRTCPRCKQHLPSDRFNRCSTTADGLQVYCRECCRARYLFRTPGAKRLRTLPYSLSVVERLELFSIPEPNSGCILWLGTVGGRGYGKLSVNNRHCLAHRVAYEAAKGPIPAGMQVCHKCDVPQCINPEHLFLGTALDNKRDSIAKNRHIHGTRHVAVKLTPEKVTAIRQDARQNVTLASEYGVSTTVISRIKRNLDWRFI